MGDQKAKDYIVYFYVLALFLFKNNEEIPSIWRHFGARLGDQSAKDYIVYFHILSHKINFLENPKFENSRSIKNFVRKEKIIFYHLNKSKTLDLKYLEDLVS